MQFTCGEALDEVPLSRAGLQPMIFENN